jgi:hypothetical protein
MSSAPARALLLGLVLVAGCKPEPHFSDAMPPDGPPPWWKPRPGEAANWDIQLAAAPFNVATPRAMYAIDLWDAVPMAMQITYAEGAPVSVPAGVHPGAIAQLHAQTPPPIVVCHVSTGAVHLTADPDAMKFPGYEASPPDRPAPIAAGSAIGYSIVNNPNLRFLDIRDARVVTLIAKRIELAKRIGCDAIVAASNEHLAYQGDPGHGFPDLTPDDYAGWSDALIRRAHDDSLSIGLRSNTTQGVSGMAARYDWLMIDRCAEFAQGTCERARTFLNLNKAAFAIEYVLDENGDPNPKATLCNELDRAMIDDAIIKTAALDTTRDVCP